MHAILTRADKSLAWCEVPDPVVKTGDILVEVHAAALNRADLLQREGNYPPPPGWPEWMGLEVAGVVLQAPPVPAKNPLCRLPGVDGQGRCSEHRRQT